MNCTDIGLDNTNCPKSLSAFLIGIIAGVFVWARQIPQIIKACKIKSLEDFSYKSLGITFLGQILMVIYGTLIFQVPIMINAPIAVSTTLTLIIQKKIYNKDTNV